MWEGHLWAEWPGGSTAVLNSGGLPGGRLRTWDKVVGEVYFQGLPFGPSSPSFPVLEGSIVPEARCYFTLRS